MNAKVSPIPGRIPQWTFAERARKVRREMGWTQQGMADALNVGLKAYSAWESGSNTPKNVLDIAISMEQITGVPKQWFIGWIDETPPGGGKLLELDSNQQPAGNMPAAPIRLDSVRDAKQRAHKDVCRDATVTPFRAS